MPEPIGEDGHAVLPTQTNTQTPHIMTFMQQLQEANDMTLAATYQNACKIAGADVPQGDMDQAVRVATALKVIDACKSVIRERIMEQGPDGTMANAIIIDHV